MAYWTTLGDLGTLTAGFPLKSAGLNNIANNPFLNLALLNNYSNDYNTANPQSSNPAPNATVELFALIDNYQRFQPRLFMLENNEILKPIQEQCTISATQATSAQIHCSLHQ
jgi:hypothetical protein